MDYILFDQYKIGFCKRTHGQAKGGQYLGVHLRRRDFLRARSDQIPSIRHAARQITKLMNKQNLKTIFLATDADQSEMDELRGYLRDYTLVRFEPTQSERVKYKDGGVAIIDQWICAHAKYFIGSFESTFTFRIQEEREIFGFDPRTTFNRLCNDKNKCEKSSTWTIVY
jgi:peptide-O-fucosyltransferase